MIMNIGFIHQENLVLLSLGKPFSIYLTTTWKHVCIYQCFGTCQTDLWLLWVKYVISFGYWVNISSGGSEWRMVNCSNQTRAWLFCRTSGGMACTQTICLFKERQFTFLQQSSRVSTVLWLIKCDKQTTYQSRSCQTQINWGCVTQEIKIPFCQWAK